MPGRQSYSAQIVTCSGPAPARAENAVGSSQIPRSTLKPAPSSVSQSHPQAFSSSKPSSGWAWMRWLIDQLLTALLDLLACNVPRVHEILPSEQDDCRAVA